jgi:hypothetical protein
LWDDCWGQHNFPAVFGKGSCMIVGG